MKRITVYADFDFLALPQEIGTLGYERVRGKDHFVFEYSHEWLKLHGGIMLSGDLMNVPSLQHPRFSAYSERMDALTCIRHKSWSQFTSMPADRPIYGTVGCQKLARCMQQLHA